MLFMEASQMQEAQPSNIKLKFKNKNKTKTNSGDGRTSLPGSIAGGYKCCFNPFLAAYLFTALPVQFHTSQYRIYCKSSNLSVRRSG